MVFCHWSGVGNSILEPVFPSSFTKLLHLFWKDNGRLGIKWNVQAVGSVSHFQRRQWSPNYWLCLCVITALLSPLPFRDIIGTLNCCLCLFVIIALLSPITIQQQDGYVWDALVHSFRFENHTKPVIVWVCFLLLMIICQDQCMNISYLF